MTAVEAYEDGLRERLEAGLRALPGVTAAVAGRARAPRRCCSPSTGRDAAATSGSWPSAASTRPPGSFYAIEASRWPRPRRRGRRCGSASRRTPTADDVDRLLAGLRECLAALGHGPSARGTARGRSSRQVQVDVRADAGRRVRRLLGRMPVPVEACDAAAVIILEAIRAVPKDPGRRSPRPHPGGRRPRRRRRPMPGRRRCRPRRRRPAPPRSRRPAPSSRGAAARAPGASRLAAGEITAAGGGEEGLDHGPRAAQVAVRVGRAGRTRRLPSWPASWPRRGSGRG